MPYQQGEIADEQIDEYPQRDFELQYWRINYHIVISSLWFDDRTKGREVKNKFLFSLIKNS
jgi:hypothetical protein